MKNSLTILGAAAIIALGLYFGLRERSAPPAPQLDQAQASLPQSAVPGALETSDSAGSSTTAESSPAEQALQSPELAPSASQRPSDAAPTEPIPATPETKPELETVAAQVDRSEDYQLVAPSELSCGLMDFSGTQEIAEGGVRILSGAFGELRCEGKVIPVLSNTVEMGFISTRDYGRIKVSASTFGGLSVYLTPTQKARLMELKTP